MNETIGMVINGTGNMAVEGSQTLKSGLFDQLAMGINSFLGSLGIGANLTAETLGMFLLGVSLVLFVLKFDVAVRVFSTYIKVVVLIASAFLIFSSFGWLGGA